VLVFFKPGLVYIRISPCSSEYSAQEYRFRLQTQKTSAAASFLSPVSGVAYVDKYDMLVVSLYDGTFHAVYGLSAEPTLTPPSHAHPTSSSLSAMARAVFVRSEDRQVRKAEMCAVYGMQSYNGAQTFVWVHECVITSSWCFADTFTVYTAGRHARRTLTTNMRLSIPAPWSSQTYGTKMTTNLSCAPSRRSWNEQSPVCGLFALLQNLH
jgi:hypothetical protein